MFAGVIGAPSKVNGSSIRLEETDDQAQQGGFAATARTDQDGCFAALESEVGGMERSRAAVRFADAGELNERIHNSGFIQGLGGGEVLSVPLRCAKRMETACPQAVEGALRQRRIRSPARGRAGSRTRAGYSATAKWKTANNRLGSVQTREASRKPADAARRVKPSRVCL